MGIGTTVGVIGGGLASAGIGAGASEAAAGTQASAAEQAQALQAQEAQNALNFQEQEFQTQQQNIAPWLKAGSGAVQTLQQIIPQLNANEANYPGFTAPTEAQAQQTPGYQFTRNQGNLAIQNSAAARGGLLSGNTAEALDQFNTGLADTTYNDVYNRALQTYQTQYQQFLNSQNSQYNRYATLAGLGQTAAGQAGQAGQAAASNIGNIALTSGAQQGQQINNAAAAQASGYIGAANAFGQVPNNLMQYLTLQQLLGGNSGLGSLSQLNSQISPANQADLAALG